MEAYSVLMAVYAKERPEYLRQAVESMLHQTVPPEEFVLVCDGPLTAELEAVIEELVCRSPGLFHILRLPENRGLGNALNAGLAHCRNELVARMDSDDLALPERMQWQLARMGGDAGLSVLGGQIAEFEESPRFITAYRFVPEAPEEIRAYLRHRSPMNHTTVLMRRSHVLQVGGYRPVPGYEDYFLWAKLLRSGFRLENLDRVCCAVRTGETMYLRRGGWRYFCNALRLNAFLWKLGLISPVDGLCNAGLRFVQALLLPPSLRRRFFLRFLRKNVHNVPRQETYQGMLPVTGRYFKL